MRNSKVCLSFCFAFPWFQFSLVWWGCSNSGLSSSVTFLFFSSHFYLWLRYNHFRRKLECWLCLRCWWLGFDTRWWFYDALGCYWLGFHKCWRFIVSFGSLWLRFIKMLYMVFNLSYMSESTVNITVEAIWCFFSFSWTVFFVGSLKSLHFLGCFYPGSFF